VGCTDDGVVAVDAHGGSEVIEPGRITRGQLRLLRPALALIVKMYAVPGPGLKVVRRAPTIATLRLIATA
jgi:hypothetical protein